MFELYRTKRQRTFIRLDLLEVVEERIELNQFFYAYADCQKGVT